MSKILKAPYISIDKENKINIEPPVFNYEAITGIDYDDDDYGDDDEPIYVDDSAELTEETILENARLEAEKIINDARQMAEQIIEDAKTKAMADVENAIEQGKSEGYEQGYTDGMNQAEEMLMEAQGIYEDSVAQRDEMINSAEPDLIELVINIVHKILSSSIKINPQVIINLIKQGISKTTITGNVFIHVSKEDYDYTIENKFSILTMIDGSTKLEIIKDFSLNKGDCIIETPFGNIDCSLEQQFQDLKQNLYYILKNG